MYDIIILGSGPAGLTAALYCARGGKKTLVLGGDRLGGQTAGIAVLENYPGWAGSGAELSEFMKAQAESFGAEIVFANAVWVGPKNLEIEGRGFVISADNHKTYESKAAIIATGASPRKLEITGAREFMGRGVSYCATCDGFFYSGKTVAVYGGGNSALNDALYLADLAAKVYIIYRKSEFTRAESVLVERVKSRENIECLFETELESIGGDETGMTFAITTGGRRIECDGLFVAIGHEANTDYLDEDILRDALGRLAPAALPAGMFVAGDVRSGLKMQIATAVGTGCEVAMDAIGYVNSSL
ncbi:MAG: FAD-dependent oxidoreductase [Rickettsiales bacterium]|jgi:thioredoxin reductase (NADPH)|nr:FAD-dependent oxidoreductase [Rickettsiales bacterium]